jgi:hypothetical protein
MGKLHDQMRDDLLLKAYSPHTLKAYLGCVHHFVRYYMRSPQNMGEKEIRGFLLHCVESGIAKPHLPLRTSMSTPSSFSTPLP